MKHPLDISWLYRAWQTPFVAQKLMPMRRRHPGLPFRRVLDVGCGPGTNAAVFQHAEYLGVDLDGGYIRDARARYGDHFIVGDASNLGLPDGRQFDCILVNSLLHHLDDDQVGRLLRSVPRLLAPGGTLFVIDLYVPDASGLPRALALADRGRFPRALPHLRNLIATACTIEVEEPFRLRLGPITLWKMVYFEARPCA
jgi:SAM-dependent methyltransferase